MINPNEFRIGNIFWEDYGGYAEIRGFRVLKREDIPAILYNRRGGLVGQISANGCYPVPITYEILINSGYEYDEITYFKKRFEIAEGFLETDPKENRYWSFWTHGLSCGVTGSIRYVHELQNLYFILNGEELEIKFIK